MTAAFLSVGFLEGIACAFGYTLVETQSSIPLVERAVRWLREERASERFFLWLDVYDPHRWKLLGEAEIDEAWLEELRKLGYAN